MRRVVPLSSVLAAALLLHLGCTVGPSYRAPVPQVESTFAGAIRVPSTEPASSQPAALVASPMAAARWWDSLHDSQLSALMDRVADSNLDVKVAQARVLQARAELAYASGTRYPTANVSAAHSHQRLSKTAAPYNAFDIPGFPWEFNQYQA